MIFIKSLVHFILTAMIFIKSLVHFNLHKHNVPDSESFCVQTANELCNNFNTIFKWELRKKIMGLPGLEYVRTTVATLHLPVSPEKYYKLPDKSSRSHFHLHNLLWVSDVTSFITCLNFISNSYRRNLFGYIFCYIQQI
jgi:hypothetical protein